MYAAQAEKLYKYLIHTPLVRLHLDNMPYRIGASKPFDPFVRENVEWY